MTNTCLRCEESFSWRRAEVSCAKCRQSYCSKCVKTTHYQDKGKVQVCRRCYNIIAGLIKDDAGSRTPPEALQKREAMWKEGILKPKSLQGPVIKPSNTCEPEYMRGLRGKDREIAERLRKLQNGDKEETKPNSTPTTKEIAARLAKNQGKSEEDANKPHIWKRDMRTQQEQVDALLDEINDEVELDARFLPPTDDIQNRLDNLKSEQTTSTSDKIEQSDSSKPEEVFDQEHSKNEVDDLINSVALELRKDATKDMENFKKDKSLFKRLRQLVRRKSNKKSDNEAQGNQIPAQKGTQPKTSAGEESPEDGERLEARKIVRQLLEEAKLEELEELGLSGAQLNMPDELPYCCLCNEDAKYKCIDCEGDLFCSRCLKTVHNKEPDYKDHRSIDFRPPKKKP